MANLRAFIAVLLSADLKDKIRMVQEQFIKVAPEVKWVAKDNFHVTLKFLGDVESERVDEICSALGSAVAEQSAFAMEVAGVGAFPNPGRPQTVWVGVKSGFECLAGIAGEVESALERVGFPKEGRRFSAHITIGRVRSDRPAHALAGELQAADVGEIGRIQINSIAVMKSDLHREGPIYSVLREIPLQLQGGGGC
ncbi:MAG: RNA 2',3'-cyclic phosphodiesterase [Armatimonadota bacterium]|nr:RNA 2',3'-cyclic phosphodiesterase [Armatimonadota bacterium]